MANISPLNPQESEILKLLQGNYESEGYTCSWKIERVELPPLPEPSMDQDGGDDRRMLVWGRALRDEHRLLTARPTGW